MAHWLYKQQQRAEKEKEMSKHSVWSMDQISCIIWKWTQSEWEKTSLVHKKRPNKLSEISSISLRILVFFICLCIIHFLGLFRDKAEIAHSEQLHITCV